MNIECIKKVMECSSRFNEAARAALEADKGYPGLHTVSGKITSALRRASMDMTRALAEMRRP